MSLWGQKSGFRCKDCSATFVDKEHFERHKRNIHKQ
ncbi:MAG: hypothetical protein KGI33_02315 [Thaumarchaeota archaeon]|nr:hypothetical protein [Nitrososphaerota archaeon]